MKILPKIYHSPDWFAPYILFCVVSTKVRDHGLVNGKGFKDRGVLGSLPVEILKYGTNLII